MGSSELAPRVDPAGLPAKPLPVDEMRSRQIEPKSGWLKPIDLLAIERLGGLALGEEGA